jgi:hypothetical protein
MTGTEPNLEAIGKKNWPLVNNSVSMHMSCTKQINNYNLLLNLNKQNYNVISTLFIHIDFCISLKYYILLIL